MFLAKDELAALVIAVCADAIQVVFLPLFAEGLLSPLDDGLDVIVFAALVATLGWDPRLLPATAVELLPIVDEAPTWTLGTALVIAGKRRASRKTDATTPDAKRQPR